ncbi:hypothetical protein E2C01_052187 [Portunus trituberculatus]|uniref:Uncharacterized protein n=1 Tax=Portunus trituberculatus TaxID=210409 RepID=A0A5B7GGW3_PORTR|nr:hypothetical protein [Portunus trituberculatus]
MFTTGVKAGQGSVQCGTVFSVFIGCAAAATPQEIPKLQVPAQTQNQKASRPPQQVRKKAVTGVRAAPGQARPCSGCKDSVKVRPSAQFPVLQGFKEGFLPFLPTTQHPLRPVPDSAACPTMYPLRWPQLDELSGYPAAFLESFPTQQWSASLHLPAPQLIPTSSSSSSSSHNLPSDLNPRDTPGIFRPWESEKKEVSENHHAAAGQ